MWEVSLIGGSTYGRGLLMRGVPDGRGPLKGVSYGSGPFMRGIPYGRGLLMSCPLWEGST